MKRAGIILAILVAAFAISFSLTACSKPADDDIQAASDMIKKAVDVGAEASSPHLLERARELLTEAKKLNEQGSYSEAHKKAQFCLLRAEQAVKNAEKLGGSAPQKKGGGGDE